MATRLKEDEKHERIIRGLLKQPANRRCINCNSLGPQYVCITFWTFVCTTCGGIHREFTHRVKSISMAKFTPQEVSSLQEGGNERAKEIYFKELDANRPGPDSSNVDRLRDFIKHVYVDRRYTGERSSDRPLRLRMADREEPYDNRRADSYHSGSRSPLYEDTYERRYGDKASPGYGGRRSPGYEQDNQRHSDYGRSPAHSGVVNDWTREDRFANGRRSEDCRSSEGDSRPEGRSPDSQKDTGIPSPPMVRPVREILSDSAPTLKVIEPPRVSGGKIVEGSSQSTQRTASSSSLASSHGKPSEFKKVDSLIDFDADPKPRATTTSTQPQQPPPAPSQPVATTTGDDNWACFDNASETKPSQTPANMNPLESMLTQLSVSAPTPSHPVSGFPVPSGAGTPAPSVSALTTANMVDSLFASTAQAPASTLPSNGAYAAAPSNTTTLPNDNASFPSGSATGYLSVLAPGLTSSLTRKGSAGQLANMQYPQQSLFPGSYQGVLSKSVTQVPGAGVGPTQTHAGIAAQPVEASGRKELPADLFSAIYSSYPVAAHGWQTGSAPGVGYPMQYNTAVPMPTFPQPAKSSNPFYIGGAAPPAQPTTFPSMAPLQAALPNMYAPGGLVASSGLAMAAPSWMPPQPVSYPSVAPQMTPSYGSTAMPPGTYMGQQLPSNLPPSRNQGFGGIRNQAADFSYLNPAPATPNPSGNPFG